jgi:Leucine-rich repeat (LRR) protein
VSGCELSRLPGGLCSLVELRWLNLSNNRLAVLPASLAACSRLTEILAAGNMITSRDRRPAWLDIPRTEARKGRKHESLSSNPYL